LDRNSICNTLLVISDIQCLPAYLEIIFSMKHVIHTNGNTVEFQYFKLNGTNVALNYQKLKKYSIPRIIPLSQRKTIYNVHDFINNGVCVCVYVCVYRYI
jgi:hypothetical protein